MNQSTLPASKVRIQLLGNNVLNLAEIQVLDSSGTNIALNKPAVQSSTYSGHASHDFRASKAINGDLTDFMHTNEEQGKTFITFNAPIINNLI